MHQKIIFSRIKAFQQQKKYPSSLYICITQATTTKKKVHTTAFKKTSKNIVAAIS